jgi:hypothetical protein
MGIDMKKNSGKIGSILFLLGLLLCQTSVAISTEQTTTAPLMTDNHNPNPPVITGPTNGDSDKIYNYNFLLTDPDGDDLTAIRIEWGGTDAGNTTYICWTCSGGNKPNGTIFVQSHTWLSPGTYTIKAKIYDTYNNESDWGTLTVTMPYTYNIPHHPFWERLLERFPYAFPLLRHLLGI